MVSFYRYGLYYQIKKHNVNSIIPSLMMSKKEIDKFTKNDLIFIGRMLLEVPYIYLHQILGNDDVFTEEEKLIIIKPIMEAKLKTFKYDKCKEIIISNYNSLYKNYISTKPTKSTIEVPETGNITTIVDAGYEEEEEEEEFSSDEEEEEFSSDEEEEEFSSDEEEEEFISDEEEVLKVLDKLEKIRNEKEKEIICLKKLLDEEDEEEEDDTYQKQKESFKRIFSSDIDDDVLNDIFDKVKDNTTNITYNDKAKLKIHSVKVFGKYEGFINNFIKCVYDKKVKDIKTKVKQSNISTYERNFLYLNLMFEYFSTKDKEEKNKIQTNSNYFKIKKDKEEEEKEEGEGEIISGDAQLKEFLDKEDEEKEEGEGEGEIISGDTLLKEFLDEEKEDEEKEEGEGEGEIISGDTLLKEFLDEEDDEEKRQNKYDNFFHK